MNKKKRLIVGISGASGITYGVHLLSLLKELNIESHLVISKAGEMTRHQETTYSSRELKDMADVSYSCNDLSACIASGSFKTMGMIVAPCSTASLAAIATGVSTNLLTRAADVVLKERRKLVLMVREMPLHAGHLKNMLAVTDMGGIIAPPVPAFYANIANLEDMIYQTLGRVLDLFDLNVERVRRWDGGKKASANPLVSVDKWCSKVHK